MRRAYCPKKTATTSTNEAKIRITTGISKRKFDDGKFFN